MASVLDQLPGSTLSLQGNRFNPQPGLSDFGFPDSTNELDPVLSRLHDLYSIYQNPQLRIKDYNRAALGGSTFAGLKKPSRLDELDPNAPNNTQAGFGGVVSQIYKSLGGRRYKDLGPQPGRY